MQKQLKKEHLTETVKHKKSTKTKIEKVIAGTAYSIGSYYDEAAEEKLKKQSSKK